MKRTSTASPSVLTKESSYSRPRLSAAATAASGVSAWMRTKLLCRTKPPVSSIVWWSTRISARNQSCLWGKGILRSLLLTLLVFSRSVQPLLGAHPNPARGVIRMRSRPFVYRSRTVTFGSLFCNSSAEAFFDHNTSESIFSFLSTTSSPHPPKHWTPPVTLSCGGTRTNATATV
jgi:hypothetical protein